MNKFIYFIIAVLGLSITSCSGVLRQDISLEKDGSGTMVYTMDYSSGMEGMRAFGSAMEDFGNSMGDAFQEMEIDSAAVEGDYEEEEEGAEAIGKVNPFSDIKMSKDTTFTIAAFMRANKDSLVRNPYYTKERMKTLAALGNLQIHEVTDLKNSSFFMEVKTTFKNLSELQNIESLMAQLLTVDKSSLKGDDGPKTGIDGFSPELLGFFIAANGVNTYSNTKTSFKKEPAINKVLQEFNASYKKLLGEDEMATAMLKSFLPKTFEVNINLTNNKVNWISDTDAYIKGDFKTVRRTYDFNELMAGTKNTALELRFNE